MADYEELGPTDGVDPPAPPPPPPPKAGPPQAAGAPPPAKDASLSAKSLTANSPSTPFDPYYNTGPTKSKDAPSNTSETVDGNKPGSGMKNKDSKNEKPEKDRPQSKATCILLIVAFVVFVICLILAIIVAAHIFAGLKLIPAFSAKP